MQGERNKKYTWAEVNEVKHQAGSHCPNGDLLGDGGQACLSTNLLYYTAPWKADEFIPLPNNVICKE